MVRKPLFLNRLCALLFIGIAAMSSSAWSEEATRAKSLEYGEVIYEYYQGHFSQALALLDLGFAQNNIQGHGDHPKLVEVGLLMTYGMVGEASTNLNELSLETLSESDQALAWFYLAKSFYLQGQLEKAKAALVNTDKTKLPKSLRPETEYLKQQVRSPKEYMDTIVSYREQVDKGERNEPDIEAVEGEYIQDDFTFLNALFVETLDIWDVYTHYNLALYLSGNYPVESVRLMDYLSKAPALNPEKQRSPEQDLLLDQIMLAKAHIQIQTQDFIGAMSSAKKLRSTSPLRDQALLTLASAASTERRYDQALSAIDWIEQSVQSPEYLPEVPYAKAYLYERARMPNRAQKAYQIALLEYEEALSHMQQFEERLQRNLEQELTRLISGKPFESMEVFLQQLDVDSFGRLQLTHLDGVFSDAQISHHLQSQLSDLADLYELKKQLQLSASKMDTFDYMIETRRYLRAQNIYEVSILLQENDPLVLFDAFEAVFQKTQQAVNEEDVFYFASEAELAFIDRLERVSENLTYLPEGEEKRAFAAQYERTKAHLLWRLYDRFAINRWSVEKPLKSVQSVLDEARATSMRIVGNLSQENDDAVVIQRISQSIAAINDLQIEIDTAVDNIQRDIQSALLTRVATKKGQIASLRALSSASMARLNDARLNLEVVDEPVSETNSTPTETETPGAES